MRSANRTVIAVVAALVAATALIAASVYGARGDEDAAPEAVPAAETLAGIPQDGRFLGAAAAPFHLVEYADLQCPYCAEFALETLPTIIDEYVRPGRVRLELRGLAFIGPDSAEALRAALGAAEQDLMWNVVERLYANQGAENSDWVTPDLLRRIGGEVAGLDVERMLAPAGDIDAAARSAAEQAQADGLQGTPYFTIAPAGGPSHALDLAGLDVASFREALERVIAE